MTLAVNLRDCWLRAGWAVADHAQHWNLPSTLQTLLTSSVEQGLQALKPARQTLAICMMPSYRMLHYGHGIVLRMKSDMEGQKEKKEALDTTRSLLLSYNSGNIFLFGLPSPP